MEIHTRSKSSLFLTEMIISILFFSIAAACCIQIFVKAHLIGQQSENLNYAQNLASSMAESLMETEGEKTEILILFPSAKVKNNTISVYYDENWTLCTEENARFLLQATFHKSIDMISGKVLISDITSSGKEGTSLFQLPFRQHIGQSMAKEK